MEEQLTVNGVKYRREQPEGLQRMIVCVDNRGLTFVGDVDLSGDDEQIVIRDARCIIRWGTSKHIAEIVKAPNGDTTLGAPADVIVFRRNLVFAYVAGEGWQ